MYKSQYLIIFLIFCVQLIWAQSDSAKMYFQETSYNFGQVYEADGYLIVSFQYVNSGADPLEISRIVAPGFEVFDYTKKAIAKNQNGIVKIKMNPFNQAGYFEKSFKIFSNSVNSPVELTVSGKILGGTFTGSFKHKVGGLAFKQAQLNFGYIFNESEVVRYIPVMNISKEVIEVEFENVPRHLTVIPQFDTLKPGQNAMVEVKYNTNEIDDWDFTLDKVGFNVKSNTVVKGFLSVTANVREDFSKLSDLDKTLKPSILIPIKVFNFDTIKKEQVTFYDFLIKNNGKRELDIRAVKPTCGCTAVMPVNNSIAPGDSTYIKVAFNSNGYTGYNKKGVTIITNDPVNYKQFLWVTGYIEP